MAQWDGNEHSCSCDCGFDIPKGGTLDKLTLKEPLDAGSGGTGVRGYSDLRSLLDVLVTKAGTISALGNTAPGEYKDGYCEFATPFGIPPIVVICFKSSSSSGTFGRCTVSVMDVTENGFSFRFFNGDASNRNPEYNWIAVSWE